jgi:hypothetical protein
MQITFTTEPMPTLTLIRHGWQPGAWFRLQRQDNLIALTLITDDEEWKTLCEDSQHGHDLGADWINYHGELVIDGDWLSEFDLTRPEHITVTTAPGRLVLTQRTKAVFRA